MMNASYVLHSPSGKQWNKIGVRHHHGINIPLFSLHSQHSLGIGEFSDLIPLIHWTKSLGFDVIQLLPLNDTGLESSPYSALSAFALSPIHLRLSTLPHLERFPVLNEALKALPQYSYQDRVDYHKVRENKFNFLKLYYQEVKELILPSESYLAFVESAQWLKGYSLFRALKVNFNWSSWETWPAEYRNPTPETIEQFCQQFQSEVELHSLIQYLCDLQMSEVKRTADAENISLMGDIPILINRDSADVWLDADLFHLEYSAGAPPDQFTADGQNWGFPIYNWTHIEKDGFSWWVRRIQWSGRYFHICRIDHIVGFFRIWAIPFGEKGGLNGIFIPTDPDRWIDHGQKIMLMMLQNSDMLLIGEDLGVIPPDVRKCLSALGICGTCVMRWERNWHDKGRFILPEDYRIDSMTTVSTHDTEMLSLWWKNNPAEARDYAYHKGWSYHPIISREHIQSILWESHHTNSLFHINLLLEYLALIPGMTKSPEEELINVPGTYNDMNWTYRFTPSVEEIISNSSLQHVMKQIIL